MRVTVLGSGSSGNAVLFESGRTRLLVDAGIRPRTLRKRLAAAHRRVSRTFDAVIVTHAHADHAGHAGPVQRSFKARLLAHDEVGPRGRFDEKDVVERFPRDTVLEIGELTIRTLPLPHDEPQIALRVSDGETSAALATDLGFAPEGLRELLEGCRVLLVESNHDPDMLARGPYPPFLKARIRGEGGHLSNDQTAELLRDLSPACRDLVLMHLSETNNRPELAIRSARRALKGRGVRIAAASQSEPLVVGRAPRARRRLSFG